MNIIKKTRESFAHQLTLWVACFVLAISAVVIFMLARFSQDVMRGESVDMTLQVLEYATLRIDNILRQEEMTARLEHKQFQIDSEQLEQLVKEQGFETTLRQSLPNAHLFLSERDSTQLGSFFSGVESGYKQIVHEGHEMFVFSQPVGDRPYVITVVCPTSDLYSKFRHMQGFIMVRGAIGISILLLIIFLVISRYLKPLHQLADSAQSIADGRLDTPIADSHHHDEIGRLQNSLATMQRSLATYMEEMHQKKATLSRQNEELQEAYRKVQEYADMKNRFLHHMTEEMATPVANLRKYTETISHDYATMSKQEMAKLQVDIISASESITRQLDLLLSVPADPDESSLTSKTADS